MTVQLSIFDELQSRLVHMGGGDPLSMPGATVVVLPSLEVDRHVLARHADVLSACEERALYQLLLLRRPDLRLVFISSEPVEEHTIRGYVELLPASERTGARARLVTLSPDDASPRPLSEKLLERPDVVERLRYIVTDPARAFMAPYAVTGAERQLALRLGLPLYGTPPDQASWGTKSGARRLFAEERIAHPAGVERVRTPEELAAAVAAVRAMRPAAAGVVVKLDDGIYGEGNRVLTFDDLPPAGGAAERDALARRIEVLGDEYLGEVAASSAIVEELLTGSELRSPSVQLRLRADGGVCELSTHEQILGGMIGQTFVGCRFPAAPEYAGALAEAGRAVAARLAREGAMGRVGVDFVAARDPGGTWSLSAIEINLRDGGTTHSFGALRLLTGGEYDPAEGVFRTPGGALRCYRASDDLEDLGWLGVASADLLDAASEEGLLYDPGAQTGTIFHMLRSLAPAGRVGLTAIGSTAREADALYARAIALLGRLAGRSERAR